MSQDTYQGEANSVPSTTALKTSFTQPNLIFKEAKDTDEYYPDGIYGPEMGIRPFIANRHNNKLALIAAILCQAAWKKLKAYGGGNVIPCHLTNLVQLQDCWKPAHKKTAEEAKATELYFQCFTRAELHGLFTLREWLKWDRTLLDQIRGRALCVTGGDIHRALLAPPEFAQEIVEMLGSFMEAQFEAGEDRERVLAGRERVGLLEPDAELDVKLEELPRNWPR